MNSFWVDKDEVDGVTGGCVCEEHYTGFHCEKYQGPCDIKCDDQCYGPYDTDCVKCNENSFYDAEKLECICLEDYFEPDCSCYKGACCNTCAISGTVYAGCNDECYEGPTAHHCQECTANAYRGDDGACHCLADYSRSLKDCEDDCTTYTGMCSWHCETCNGPEASDCVQCFPHASGSNCACDDNWGGMDCEVYLGECAPVCDGCTGPLTSDCTYCSEFAARMVDD